MEEINIKKHTKYTLELIFSEADKHLSDVLNSILRSSNRSFYLFGLYLTVIAFSFSEILNSKYEYSVLLFGTILSSLVLKNNLFPSSRYLKGSSPIDMIIPYFNNFKNKTLEKEYLACQIQSYNDSIENNKELLKKMTNNYSKSFKLLIITFLIFFIIFLILFIKYN